MSKDKKQFVVLGALVLVIVAVGAFQFMGSKSKPAAAEETTTEKKADETLVAENTEVDPTKLAIGMLLDGQGAPRDPFIPQAVLIEEPTDQNDPFPTQSEQQTQPVSEFGNNNVGPVVPNVGQNGAGVGITPDEPLRNPNDPPYTLRGVIIGKKTMAMFEDENGRSILAREGQKIASDTTVLAISETEVVVQYKNKVKTLVLLGGN